MNELQSSFELLSPNVRKWVFDQRWKSLRGIQEAAIPLVLAGQEDVLISSPTASGKTEAAFLPLFSLLDQGNVDLVIAISPLKALINDQVVRLEPLAEACGVPLTPWHGDAPAGPKRAFEENPRGVLMITPESLEAMHVLRGPAVRKLLGHCSAFVVDELHAFTGAERGRQLQSLMSRIEAVASSFVPRIGLSATMGDIGRAAEFLRPSKTRRVQTVQVDGDGRDLRIGLKGYLGDEIEAFPQIARDIFSELRGRDHLVFTNRRRDVEYLADELRTLSESNSVPNEFFPHHGSLSRPQREFVEERLRDKGSPTTAICTSTLELGIDVGSVESIGQIGAPHSVSALRQRLGRSGRRNEDPATLRTFIREMPVAERDFIYEQLGVPIIQTIAVIELLLEGWCEAPRNDMLALSTLVQQVLSLITERHGIRAQEAWKLLCSDGAFPDVEPDLFADLLRSLHAHDLVQQAGDGELMLGVAGERLTAHYDFYSAFTSPVEYRVVADSGELGTVPVTIPVVEGLAFLFSGRRWVVDAVDDKGRTIHVSPTQDKKPTRFSGFPGFIDVAIRKRMFDVYVSLGSPQYLDARAAEMLTLARDEFKLLGLDKHRIVGDEAQWRLFPWCGDRELITIMWSLRARGLDATVEAVSVVVKNCPQTELFDSLEFIASTEVNPVELAAIAEPKSFEKHHRFLSEALLNVDYASSVIDVGGARSEVLELLENTRTVRSR